MAPSQVGEPSPRRLILILGLGAWLLLSAIVASQNYVEYRIAETPVPFLLQAVWMLAVLAYWVAMAPLALWLCRKFPFEPGRLPAHFGVHLLAAAVIALVHAPLVVLVTSWLQPFPVPPGLGFWKALGFTITASFHTDLLLYAVIVGGGVAYAGYQRARRRQLDAARLEVELSEARLRALEAQIRPHFLFNALNTIAMLVRTRDTERAVGMVAELGELLRESLRQPARHEVPLSREIELARRYIEVERCRFADRLAVRIDVPAALEPALVPHLIVQPLVENAVRHGVERSGGQGTVEITASRDRDELVLEVRDNGNGARPSTPGAAAEGSGVGLDNVRTRLEQLYGAASSVRLERASAGGTIQRITLPFHLEERLPPRAP